MVHSPRHPFVARLLFASYSFALIGGAMPLAQAQTQVYEPLGHQPIPQAAQPLIDENLERLKIGDRLWEEGKRDEARQYYQQAKPPFAAQTDAVILDPISDPAALSPAATVYWRNAQTGLAQNLTNKALISLDLLAKEAPNFIPGRIAQIQQLQQSGEIEQASVAMENSISNYGNSEELMDFSLGFYEATEQWLEASLAARQFALLNPDHPRQAEFLAVADQHWERYQGELRAELRGNAIANLITGAVGFALTGSLLGPLTALESSALLLQGEEAVGDRISRRIQEVAPMVADETVLAYVKEIGDQLTPFLGQDRFNYEYYVILDDELNAFALPGGKLFIHAGAILESRSEAELAGIISHEIAHAALSHGFQLVTQGNLTANITSTLPFGRIAGSLLNLNYSRGMERQADALGTRILAASPYAADGLYNLTVTLKAGDRPDAPPAWLSSHPGLDERLENIETQIVEYNYDRYTFEGVSRHQEIQKIVQQLMDAETAKDKKKD